MASNLSGILEGGWRVLGPVSISDKTYCYKILQTLEAAILVFRIALITLKFDRHISSITAEVFVKFQSDIVI